jgi:hypothetical protein
MSEAYVWRRIDELIRERDEARAVANKLKYYAFHYRDRELEEKARALPFGWLKDYGDEGPLTPWLAEGRDE